MTKQSIKEKNFTNNNNKNRESLLKFIVCWHRRHWSKKKKIIEHYFLKAGHRYLKYNTFIRLTEIQIKMIKIYEIIKI